MNFLNYFFIVSLLTVPFSDIRANFKEGFVYGATLGACNGVANQACEKVFGAERLVTQTACAIPIYLLTTKIEGEYLLANSRIPNDMEMDRLAGVLLGHGFAQSIVESIVSGKLELRYAVNIKLLVGLYATLVEGIPAAPSPEPCPEK